MFENSLLDQYVIHLMKINGIDRLHLAQKDTEMLMVPAKNKNEDLIDRYFKVDSSTVDLGGGRDKNPHIEEIYEDPFFSDARYTWFRLKGAVDIRWSILFTGKDWRGTDYTKPLGHIKWMPFEGPGELSDWWGANYNSAEYQYFGIDECRKALEILTDEIVEQFRDRIDFSDLIGLTLAFHFETRFGLITSFIREHYADPLLCEMLHV